MTVLKMCCSMCNFFIYYVTRTILMVISKGVYQCFVLTEVFLNSFNLVYPPYLSKPITSVYYAVENTGNVFWSIIAIKVKQESLFTIHFNKRIRQLLQKLIN